MVSAILVVVLPLKNPVVRLLAVVVLRLKYPVVHKECGRNHKALGIHIHIHGKLYAVLVSISEGLHTTAAPLLPDTTNIVLQTWVRDVEVDVVRTTAGLADAARTPDGEQVRVIGVQDLEVGLTLGVTDPNATNWAPNWGFHHQLHGAAAVCTPAATRTQTELP